MHSIKEISCYLSNAKYGTIPTYQNIQYSSSNHTL
jgi:catabolite regulation protein CreA